MNYNRHSIQKILLPLIAGIQIFFGAACTGIPPCPKLDRDNISYGWRGGNFMGEWDDYYQCALSYIESGFYPEALDALEEAADRRYRDQRMARSYGLHFVDNYFPHREKAWVYYLLGRYEKALSELEVSIRHEPSDKAFKIQDKVLIEIMKRKVMEQELTIENPDLRLQFPSVKSKSTYIMTMDKSGNSYTIWTKDDLLVLSGIATDRVRYISEIIIKDDHIFPKEKRFFLDHSSKAPVKFEEDFRLNQGEYRFDITARNLLYGIYDDPTVKPGETSLRVNVHIDRSGPVIVITKLHPNVGIQGYLYDVSGVESLIADGKPVAISTEKGNMFTVPVKSKGITLLVRDRLGNETKALVGSERLALSSYPILLAQAGADTLTDAGRISLVQNENPPEITLMGWSDEQTVYMQRINIQGRALSLSPMTKLSINHMPVLPRVAGRNILFNQSVDLEPGKNIIIIEAKNRAGTSTERVIVNRKIPEAYQLKYRYRVALPPFLHSDRTIKWDHLRPLLLRSFTSRGRFQVMLRKNQDKASNSGDVPCHSTLFGLLNETKDGFELIARIVDIKTSTILAIEDSYSFTKNRVRIEWAIERLVEKLHRKFPLTEGIIKSTNWRSFSPEFGKGDIYASDIWPMVVFRNDEPMINMATGESLGYDTSIIGHECFKGKCGILPDHQKPRKGDMVLTQ